MEDRNYDECRPGNHRDISRVRPVSSFSPARLRVTDIPLECATKPVVAGFSPRSLSSKRTILSSRRTVVYLHPANASRHQRKSLFSYPVRFGLSRRRPARSSSQRKEMRNGDFDGNPHFPGSTELRSRRSEFRSPPEFTSEQHRSSPEQASMLFGSAPLNADLGGEPGGAHHALPRILKLVKTCSPLLVVISLLEILTSTSSCCDDRI